MLFHKITAKKRVYLDYAAATPLRQSVARVMRPYFSEVFANPSAIHKNGLLAREAIENARLRLARVLQVRPNGVIFTASGTESNNLALFGVVQHRHNTGTSYADMEIITTDIEHPSVGNTLKAIEKLGVTIKYVAVDEVGRVIVDELEELLNSKTVLVSVAYVNSEIGTIQDLGRIARIVKAFNKKNDKSVFIHADAAQAPLWCDIDTTKLGVDILTLDAGKCYGPKGVGVLAYRYGINIEPVFFGGAQEFGLRPGTENTAQIVGAAEAIVRASNNFKKNRVRVSKLRDQTITSLLSIEGVFLNGSTENRVANNINVSIPGLDAEFMVISLDQAGIAASTKSACGGVSGSGSKVVKVVTGDTARSESTLRVTLGEETTVSDLRKFLTAIKNHIAQQRVFQKNLTQT